MRPTCPVPALDIEAAAVVLDLDDQLAILGSDRDTRRSSPGVLPNIRQRLLDDPHELDLGRCGQRERLSVLVDLQVDVDGGQAIEPRDVRTNALEQTARARAEPENRFADVRVHLSRVVSISATSAWASSLLPDARSFLIASVWVLT